MSSMLPTWSDRDPFIWLSELRSIRHNIGQSPQFNLRVVKAVVVVVELVVKVVVVLAAAAGGIVTGLPAGICINFVISE